MRRVVATLMVAGTLVLSTGSADVSGQAGCSFVRGFATLRDLVGAQKVGACLEDERFNGENGNAEQQTAGGLLVWRKADNFTAFTDGATTWVNGPNGLQTRPNGERFSWELDPVTTARSSPSSPPAPSSSPASVSVGSGTTAPAGAGASASTGAAQTAPAAVSSPAPAATSTATRAATSTATATVATTPTPTPNPVQVKFREKPDQVETGNDAQFEVETNAKKGTCALLITYRNSSQVNLGATDIEDGRCEWKYTLAADTRTGKATAQVTVTANGGTATVEDTFSVRKGDTTLAGDIDVELEADELPDKVTVGEQFEISIDTNLKNRGSCEVAVMWPRLGQEAGERKTPNNSGRCSWKMTVPTTIEKSGTATLTVVVTRNKNSARIMTKEFDVKR